MHRNKTANGPAAPVQANVETVVDCFDCTESRGRVESVKDFKLFLLCKCMKAYKVFLFFESVLA